MDQIKKCNVIVILLALALGLVFVSAPDPSWAGKASERHEKECKEWCSKTENCEFCSTNRGCGQGYEAIRSWTGWGKNWHACAKRETRREAGIRHKDECQKWCDQNPGCAKCSKLAGCGKGYRTLKKWTGRGENYYACEKREKTDQASQNNKTACLDFCKGRVNPCECRNTTCGRGWFLLMNFGGAGENWHACAKRKK